jgi:hypothetical protein
MVCRLLVTPPWRAATCCKLQPAWLLIHRLTAVTLGHFYKRCIERDGLENKMDAKCMTRADNSDLERLRGPKPLLTVWGNGKRGKAESQAAPRDYFKKFRIVLKYCDNINVLINFWLN